MLGTQQVMESTQIHKAMPPLVSHGKSLPKPKNTKKPKTKKRNGIQKAT
jgi:hypothetical protein